MVLFVFNTGAYWLYVSYAVYKSGERLEAKLDQGYYNTTDLITLKIPLNLPYQADRNEFERVDGEVNVDGIIYKYVQRKVYDDTLIVQCIPHTEKAKLQQTANDYFGKLNDLPGRSTNKKAEIFKQLFSDYEINSSIQLSPFSKQKKTFYSFSNPSILHHFPAIDGQPPELIDIES